MKAKKLLAVGSSLLLVGTLLFTSSSSLTKAEETETLSITADCSAIEREVDPGMFGYILTPNYDVPDSRISLLGNPLNRETLPVQNFQAIGDMDGSYYSLESSIKERHLEAYRRAKACGCDWYMLLGLNPSWATASGSPVDSTKNKNLKTPEQIARFKQYVKDMLQYMKDNGAKPDFADLTNEYWTGTQETFKACWEAVREVYPDDIPCVGPGAVGYDGIKDFYIPYCTENDITVEGPAWHAYWKDDKYATFSQLTKWVDKIAKLQAKYPKANGKYIIWEENNAGSLEPTDWTRSMSNVIRTGVDKNIKGCLEDKNWNGMSDLLTTNVKAKNSAARRPIWWVYYMFSQMSGDYVKVDTNGNEEFTGVVAVDKNEKQAKVVIAKNGEDGKVEVKLNKMPFDSKDAVIDLYKITKSENEGLEYQKTIKPSMVSEAEFTFFVEEAKANETWYAVVKLPEAKPGFFAQKTPDDGDAVTAKPELIWGASVGATSYDIVVSQNKDLSEPVIEAKDLKETTYQIEKELTVGEKYYWSVSAKNDNGTTTVSHNVKYSFLVSESADVPGQFGPYLPSVGFVGEATKPTLKWSTAYNADSYHVVISKNKDLSNPDVDVKDVKTIQGTGQFGENSQGIYKVTKALDFETTYYWMIYAVNKNGERPMNGVPHYFKTRKNLVAPAAFELTYPANQATDVDGRAELTWNPSANFFYYHLEISDKPDMSNLVLERTHMIYNKYRLEQNALKPGKTYYWRVTALAKTRQNKTECIGGVHSFTMKKTPSSPLLYANQPGAKEGTVDLWYRGSEKAKYYIICYGKEPGKYTKEISGITETSHTVTGLKGGQTYYFAVKAVNYDGESTIWNERSVVPKGTGENWKESDEEESNFRPVLTPEPEDTPEPEVTPAPQVQPETPVQNPVQTVETTRVEKPAKAVLKKLQSKKKKTVLVTWKKQKADGYQIYISLKKNMKSKKVYTISSGKSVTKTIKKLTSKKKYFVKVRAYKKVGKKKVYGAFSKTLSIKVK